MDVETTNATCNVRWWLTIFDEQTLERLWLISLRCKMEVGVATGISLIQQLWQLVRPVEHVQEAWGVLHQGKIHLHLHGISKAVDEAGGVALHVAVRLPENYQNSDEPSQRLHAVL